MKPIDYIIPNCSLCRSENVQVCQDGGIIYSYTGWYCYFDYDEEFASEPCNAVDWERCPMKAKVEKEKDNDKKTWH